VINNQTIYLSNYTVGDEIHSIYSNIYTDVMDRQSNNSYIYRSVIDSLYFLWSNYKFAIDIQIFIRLLLQL